jgi:geranylgeranyl pyrophosphate synthase
MGVYAGAGRGAPAQAALRAAEEYAENLGLAFQIQDDILDVTATTQTLGKPVGSDRANQKTTFATLLGVSASKALVREHTDRAKAALGDAFSDSGFLCWLADKLAERER